MLATSLTEDKEGLEVQYLEKEVDRVKPAVMVVDTPIEGADRPDIELEGFRDRMKAKGWVFTEENVLCTRFGDPQARARLVLHGEDTALWDPGLSM